MEPEVQKNDCVLKCCSDAEQLCLCDCGWDAIEKASMLHHRLK